LAVTRRVVFNAAGALMLAEAAPPAVPAAAASPANRPHRAVLMKLGTQEPTSEENFQRFQRYGIRNVGGWYR